LKEFDNWVKCGKRPRVLMEGLIPPLLMVPPFPMAPLPLTLPFPFATLLLRNVVVTFKM